MDVLMPQLGETVAEGKIVKWFKSAGDAVKPGDNLFEIETDKTSMEVPATSAGTLTDIRFKVGETAKVGTVVAVISDGSAMAVRSPQSAATASPVSAQPAPLAPEPVSTPSTAQAEAPGGAQRQAALDSRFCGNEREDDRSFAYPNMGPFHEVRTPERNYGPARVPGGAIVTPLARRLADERGINLAKIKGSGPHGRIVARDVSGAAPSTRSLATGATAAQVKVLYNGITFEEQPLDATRRTIAARMVEAQQTVPHLILTADLDAGRLLAMRDEANAAAPTGQDGQPTFKLSLDDFIVKAWAAALLRVPAANAVFAEDRILQFRRADIGVAIALDGRLIAPVIRNVETRSLTAISAEMRDLAERAAVKKLKPEEVQGGVSTISNLGMYGVREFSAIINPPQSSLLTVGAVHRAPMETEDGSVKFISRMIVTLSCDHRVLDGALGGELLAAFKALAETPVTALV